MFLAAAVAIAIKIKKVEKYLAFINRKVDKMWCILTVDYYVAGENLKLKQHDLHGLIPQIQS